MLKLKQLFEQLNVQYSERLKTNFKSFAKKK
jgi:hypothetical protein